MGRLASRVGRHVQHHVQVHAGIHLGVVVGALWHAPQAVHFGQQARQGTAIAQYIQHARGRASIKPRDTSLPYPFWHQVIHFALCHHVAHQRTGVLGDVEVGEPGRKASQTQKCGRGLPRRLSIHGAAPCGPDSGGRRRGRRYGPTVLGHGVDGQVATGEVFFRVTLGAACGEAVVAVCPLFALGSRQGVFLPCWGVQENGKVFGSLGCSPGPSWPQACCPPPPNRGRRWSTE